MLLWRLGLSLLHPQHQGKQGQGKWAEDEPRLAVLAWCAHGPGFDPQHWVIWVGGGRHVPLPALGRRRQKEEKLKAIPATHWVQGHPETQDQDAFWSPVVCLETLYTWSHSGKCAYIPQC